MAEHPHPTDKHIGAKVRVRRKQLGMSQTVLAEKLGVTFQQLQKNETGVNRIGASRMQQIAIALKVPVRWFFAELPQASGDVMKDSPSTKAFDDFLTLPYTVDFVEHYAKLTNQQRDVVVRVARALAEGRPS